MNTWQRVPDNGKKFWAWERRTGDSLEIVKWCEHMQRWTAQRRIGHVDCISGMATTAEKAKELLG